MAFSGYKNQRRRTGREEKKGQNRGANGEHERKQRRDLKTEK